ncbi:hypothetical protein [Methylomonas albis]|nr:hypothetical protein [Methylomonas albis]
MRARPMIVPAWEQKDWNLRANFNLAGPTCSSLQRLIY